MLLRLLRLLLWFVIVMGRSGHVRVTNLTRVVVVLLLLCLRLTKFLLRSQTSEQSMILINVITIVVGLIVYIYNIYIKSYASVVVFFLASITWSDLFVRGV